MMGHSTRGLFFLQVPNTCELMIKMRSTALFRTNLYDIDFNISKSYSSLPVVDTQSANISWCFLRIREWSQELFLLLWSEWRESKNHFPRRIHHKSLKYHKKEEKRVNDTKWKLKVNANCLTLNESYQDEIPKRMVVDGKMSSSRQ